MIAQRLPGARSSSLLLPLLFPLLFWGAPARAQTSPPVYATTPAPTPTPSSTSTSDDHIPLRLALGTASAFGVAPGSFYNQLVGARLDFLFSPRVSLGGALDYANLKGKDGRASSALVTAELEYRAGDPASAVRFPLRFASGYLGGNGPVVRASAGLAFRLSPAVDLVTELVAPTVWLTNNQSLLSFDLGLELGIRL